MVDLFLTLNHKWLKDLSFFSDITNTSDFLMMTSFLISRLDTIKHSTNAVSIPQQSLEQQFWHKTL
jgi:hypothetical protein